MRLKRINRTGAMRVVVTALLLNLMLGATGYGRAGQAEMERLRQSIRGPGRPGAVPPGRRDAGARGQDEQRNVRIGMTEDGYVRHLGTGPGSYFAVDDVVTGSADETARNFLQEHAGALGVRSAAVDFSVLRSNQVKGREFVRFRQTYGGLSVFAGEAIVQVNTAGGVEYLMSDIIRDTNSLDSGEIALEPAVTAEQAEAIARAVVSGDPDDDFVMSEPEVVVFDPEVVGSKGPVRTVWDVTIGCDAAADGGAQLLIDAHTGEIVRRYPLGKTALDREIYNSANTNDDMVTLVRDEGDGATGDADVDNCYDFFGDVYDFYNSHHGRDGLNGSGMKIVGNVRYCRDGDPCPWSNSMWRSWPFERMYFGDGEPAADDIVGHEYTHGVTDFESDLVYENASGAINESFSDIWGEYVDLWNGVGTDTAAVRWELFEDSPGGTSRDMSNPPLHSQPDRLNSPLYVPAVADPNSANDFGGVHRNSGVGNKLCYLLTDGDSFNGWETFGIGMDRVADLFYEVQTDLLSSGSDWQDLANALEQAAVNMGWTDRERNNVYWGIRAVEIYGGSARWYVDGGYIGPEFGTELFPYNTVGEGVNAAFPGDTVSIKAGSYNEAMEIDKALVIEARNGGVTIGD